MKKIISLLMIAALVFSLSACSEEEKKDNVSSKKENASAQNETSSSVDETPLSEDKTESANLSNVNEFIELCSYKDYEIDWSEGTANQIMNSYLSKNCTINITDRPVKDGDVVNIDYVGKKDGVAFDGGTASGYDLTIGSNSFIDGFEEGLIGAELGETRDLNLTFPEQYHSADLAGADVVFTVTINSIKGISNKKEDIEKAKKASTFDVILLYLSENSKFKSFPAADIETYKKQYASYGDEMAEQYAKETVKQLLSILAYAKSEGITVSDSEMDKQAKKLAQQTNMTATEVESTYGKNYIELMIVLEKVQASFE